MSSNSPEITSNEVKTAMVVDAVPSAGTPSPKPKRRNRKNKNSKKDQVDVSSKVAPNAVDTPAIQVDELVEYSKSSYATDSTVDTASNLPRYVNIILDHSSFIRGIGNIKRWFNEEYIKKNLSPNRASKTILNFFIPTYTLHEFEFSKKGNSMMATNAREAIRFIDKLFENEDNRFNINDSKKGEEDAISYNLYIESPSEAGPSWNDCAKYKVHSPKVKEFPNFKTKFDSNLIGQSFASQLSGSSTESESMNYQQNSNAPAGGSYFDEFSSLSIRSRTKLNDIQYENSESYLYALANSDNLAEMPARLRYLIRACIYKQYVEPKRVGVDNDWKLVTEDPITKIWAKSFGLNCLNVNEAEVLIFQNHDVNSFKLYNPHNAYNIGDDDYSHESNVLQNTIDTTQYLYESVDKPKQKKTEGSKKTPKKGKSKEAKAQRKQYVEGVVDSECIGINGDLVKKERYDTINYAPRLKGELWRP